MRSHEVKRRSDPEVLQLIRTATEGLAAYEVRRGSVGPPRVGRLPAVGRWFVVLGVLLSSLATSAGAQAKPAFAPLDRPGPQLSVPKGKLEKSLRCSNALHRSTREWILLVPPTVFDSDEAYDWNYQRAFDAKKLAYCTITVPNHGTGDIQIAAEYVVFAIRRIQAVTGRKVQVVGWSQGAGPSPRWAIRWWPDVRDLVDDLIAIAPPNHGTQYARVPCASGECGPAWWQQRDDSRFIGALNAQQETFTEISYTVIYSRTDELVQPSVDGSAAVIRGGRNVINVATQDVCPADASDHISILASSPAFALVFDALENAGPADTGRIDQPAVCSHVFHPYAESTTFPAKYVELWDTALVRPNASVAAEPPLKCYVTDSCAHSSTPPERLHHKETRR